jgi:site-specific DNA-methyltransferase (adenine-specific)
LEVMPTLSSASVDLVLCDLPYGMTDCKWDRVIPLDRLWEQYRRLLRPKGAVVLTSMQPFTTRLTSSNLKWFKYCWVWVKSNCGNFANAKKQPLRAYEEICVFYPQQCTYNPQGLWPCNRRGKGSGGEVYGSSLSKDYTQTATGYPKNILTFPSERGFHPTQKPVALMEYFIRTYTDDGACVLDNCMGSGTTGVACINTGRKFVGIEQNPDYFATAKSRIKAARHAGRKGST